MSHDPNEVVKVYAGPLVVVEAYKQALADAGIESKMTGDSLLASFGSAIPGSIELYVHQGDAEKALAAIKQYEETRPKDGGEGEHPRPTDEANPAAAQHRQKHHIPQHPTGQ
jgi:hypothetical protein